MDNIKCQFNFETVHARQKMCIEHQQETVVELSTSDVSSGLARPLATKSTIRRFYL
jgi:hypothetical protein